MTPDNAPAAALHSKVLTVSDGVASGVRDDTGGRGLVSYLSENGFTIAEHRVVADGRDTVSSALIEMANEFAGLIVTTGGTGFAPRDLTPEGTRAVIEREAPGLAEAMRLISPFGRLSRGVAGIRGTAIICNCPGSPTGAIEQLGAIIDIIPHALALLAQTPTVH